MNTFWILVLMYSSNGITVADRYFTIEECQKVGAAWKDAGTYNRNYQCLPGPAPKRLF